MSTSGKVGKNLEKSGRLENLPIVEICLCIREADKVFGNLGKNRRKNQGIPDILIEKDLN